MRSVRGFVFSFVLMSLPAGALRAQCTASSASNILTGQYNGFRTGANSSETILTPSNVTASDFGYLYSLPVDTAPVFAQPLVFHNLTINGTQYCTVVFVATMDNYIYAFNGDEPPTQAAPYIWKSAQFGTPVTYGPYIGFTTMGIMDTPVIDANNQILYFVSLAQESGGLAGWTYRLHAISLTTGTEFFPANQAAPGGVVISGSVPGDGDDSTGGMVPFIAAQEKPRAALLDVNGTIYTAFGFGNPTSETESSGHYHGWSFAYKSCLAGSLTCATDPPCFTGSNCGLQQISILVTTPNSHAGGIWMSGRGPASDGAGNVFLSVGNGCKYDVNPALCGPDGYSESVLNVTNLDFYVPNATTIAQLDYNDEDLDAAGILMIPPVAPATASKYLLAGAKTGTVTLLNPTGLAAQSGNPVQAFQSTAATAECPANLPVYGEPALGTKSNPGTCDELHSPVYYSRGSTGYLYVWGYFDALRAYSFNTSGQEQFNPTPVATYSGASKPGNGGLLAVSSNGTASPILWAVTGTTNFAKGSLSAYRLWNPETNAPVLSPLWDSSDNGVSFFSVQRFTSPVVSNGKVFVTTPSTDANGNTQILVYGLCSDVSGGCRQPLLTPQYLLR
jgi:hypothetical protein